MKISNLLEENARNDYDKINAKLKTLVKSDKNTEERKKLAEKN